LYIISLEPIPYTAETKAEEILLEVTRMRDACILMANHRCYREFPQSWVERMLASHGFKVLETQRLPILYSEASIRRQINVGRSKLPRIKDRCVHVCYLCDLRHSSFPVFPTTVMI
jgi:hypothetical protein